MSLKKALTQNSRSEIEHVFCTHNCDLFVLGPELAMLSIPLPWWLRNCWNSSLKAFPQADSPPVPVPVGSPPWI